MLALADPPTAIFAGNDIQAMGAYEAARLLHLRVPDDLSVVGFDDLPMSAWVSPPLTTVSQPLAQMAAIAARTVLAMLDGAMDTSNNRMELSTSLVVRASTSPPARRAGQDPAAGPQPRRSTTPGHRG
jgi:LacI family xylobiose transport system transcriptional regulator